MAEIGNWVIPLLVFVAAFAAVVHKVPAFDAFVSGAKTAHNPRYSCFPLWLG